MGEELLSGLSTVAGALGLFGRRRRPNLSSAASKRRMSTSAKADIAESEAEIARLKAEFETLRSEMEQAAQAVTDQWKSAADAVEEVRIAPRKTDVAVQMVALAWAPTWEITFEDLRGRQRSESIPAYAGPNRE